jgi:hypothetical protein
MARKPSRGSGLTGRCGIGRPSRLMLLEPVEEEEAWDKAGEAGICGDGATERAGETGLSKLMGDADACVGEAGGTSTLIAGGFLVLALFGVLAMSIGLRGG